jgi:hypothetical protein
MPIQICNRCHSPRDLEDFYLNPSGKSRRKICKQCFKDADTKWRADHRTRVNARAMKWYYANPTKSKEINGRNYRLQNEKRNQVLSSIFNDHPCLVCGDKRHGCLSFHHLDPKEKEYGVTSHSLTWKGMLKEASKCVVLCLNCHTLYHRGDIQLPEKLTPIDVSKYRPEN